MHDTRVVLGMLQYVTVCLLFRLSYHTSQCIMLQQECFQILILIFSGLMFILLD